MNNHAYRAAKFWHGVYRDTPHQKHRLAPIPVADMLAMARAVLHTQEALEALDSLIGEELEKLHADDLDVRGTYRHDYVAGLEEAYALIEHALKRGGSGA